MSQPSPQYLGQRRAWERPATVYRMFDAEGRLLYVGASLNPFVRFNEHRTLKPWFFEVASVTFEHFEDRADALEAEAQAIWTEHPKHNTFSPSHDLLARQRRDSERAKEAA